MLKSLFPKINWEVVKVVGFDLDGTLYDEFEFICQVYECISSKLAEVCSSNASDIYHWMLRRWLEQGSSYNLIFEEVLRNHEIHEQTRNDTIENCVGLFRNFKPNLELSQRTKFLLNHCQEKFPLFLVSDGSASLQTAKFKSLGLEEWFEPANIAISGWHGPHYQKPATLALAEISCLSGVQPKEVVFFGDRTIDYMFAENAGFQFVLVRCFQVGD